LRRGRVPGLRRLCSALIRGIVRVVTHRGHHLKRRLVRLTALSAAAIVLAAGTPAAAEVPVQPTDPAVYENRPVASIQFRAPAGPDGQRPELSERAQREALNAVRTLRGDIFDAQVVAEDVRRLTRLGLFGTVETLAGLNDDGTVTVVFEVAERPLVVDVQAVGNSRLNDAEIAAVIDVVSGTPVDRFQIDRSARRIEDLYRTKGYYAARVALDEEELADGGIVIFRIREGDRLKVTGLRFEGNANFTTTQLRRELETKKANIFRKGQLDDDKLDTDIGNLIAFYRDRGYLDVRADRIIQPSPDGREAIITYVVEEGAIYTLRSVQVDIETEGGEPVLSQPQISGLIKIKPGDVYGVKDLENSVTAVASALGQMGYADAQVTRVEKRDPQQPVVDLIFVVLEGPRSRVGEVIIQGNDLTRQEVVRRQIEVRPMRPLDTTAIDRTRRQLTRLRLFNERPPVRVTPLEPGLEFYAEVWDENQRPNSAPSEPAETETPEGTDPPTTPLDQPADLSLNDQQRYRDVLVEVEETNTGEFNFGGAVSSDSGLIGRIALIQRNFDIRDTPDSPGEFFSGRAFRGGGQTFQLELLPGDRVETYTLGLTEPYLFESDFSGSAQVFYRNRDFDEFDERRGGLRLGLGRRYGTRWTGNLKLRAETVELSDIQPDRPTDVFEVADQAALFGLSASLERSTIDSIFRPTRGSRTKLEVEQVIGDYTFTNFNARHTVFVPIREDYLDRPTVLSLAAEIGYIPQGNEDTPTYERYYLGGQTFRGFDFRTISPKGIRNDNGQPSDDPVGGSWLVFLGAEVSQPIYEEVLSIVFFVDTGTVTEDAGLDDYRVSVGTGLRLYIPQLSPAPLAFDFGIPVIKQDTDERRLFTFTVDLPF
jgi:outer membrane protein insertion porin family